MLHGLEVTLGEFVGGQHFHQVLFFVETAGSDVPLGQTLVLPLLPPPSSGSTHTGESALGELALLTHGVVVVL